MNRWVIAIVLLVFSISFSTKPLPATSRLIFEGKVSARDGLPVTGAEIQIFDGAGIRKHHLFSDLEGIYRSPALVASTDPAEDYKIEISHVRYQPVRVNDPLEGATIGSTTGSEDPAPGRTAAPPPSTRIVHRDFVLEPSRGTPQYPTTGPHNLNYAEYCYQQALIHMGNQRNREAVELFKLYVQIGGNRRQIARALQLIAQIDK